MIDFVADSVNQFQVMEEDVYTQQLHEALDCALDSLDPACALHIRQRYYQGMSFRKIADREGCDWQTIRQQEESSFQKLRCGSCAPLLRSFRYWDSEFDIYTKQALQGSSEAQEVSRKNLQNTAQNERTVKNENQSHQHYLGNGRL